MSICLLQFLLDIVTGCDNVVFRRSVRRYAAWNRLPEVQWVSKKSTHCVYINANLKLYVIISPKKQRYRITTHTAAIDSAVNSRLEDIIYTEGMNEANMWTE